MSTERSPGPEPLKENKVETFAAGVDDGRYGHGKRAQKCRAGKDFNEPSGEISTQDPVDGGTPEGKENQEEKNGFH